MAERKLLVAPWSALRNLDTGRLGYLGTLASGNLTHEERQYAVWTDVVCLPREEREVGSYCLIGIHSDEKSQRLATESTLVGAALPLAASDIEVAYFTSSVRRREFLDDLRVSGLLERGLPFATLVYPGAIEQAGSAPEEAELVSQAKTLNRELAYQERISAAICCAEALNWPRASELVHLRESEGAEKFQHLRAWARCVQGVVDDSGAWSRTSVEQVLPTLESEGLGEQVAAYKGHVDSESWPESDSATIAIALLLLARTEGGRAESLLNMIFQINGLKMPPKRTLADIMILLAVALGRHHLPEAWQPRPALLGEMVATEIRHAASSYIEHMQRMRIAAAKVAHPKEPAEVATQSAVSADTPVPASKPVSANESGSGQPAIKSSSRAKKVKDNPEPTVPTSTPSEDDSQTVWTTSEIDEAVSNNPVEHKDSEHS
jgi:hypothetical protein